VSVFETLSQARKQAREYPRLGKFIAELVVPIDAPVVCERTTRTEGHWTLWASAGDLVGRVVMVVSA
jgi:hypothetical protein